MHSSWLHEHPDAARGHNERLEHLGDAVVNLAISQALYERHPDDDEGDLSARRAAIVSTAGLAQLATRIDLGEALLLGEGESQRDGRSRPSLLASSFEALAGALYLDAGFDAGPDMGRRSGDARTRRGLLGRGAEEPEEPTPGTHPAHASVNDPSIASWTPPGPDHDRSFRIEVTVAGEVLGVGEGPSRRVAETAAAAQAMDHLRGPDLRAARTCPTR